MTTDMTTTQPAGQLAWSLDTDQPTTPIARRSWTVTTAAAVTLVGVGLTTALAIALFPSHRQITGHATGPSATTQPVTPTQVPQPVTSAPASAPAAPAPLPQPDRLSATDHAYLDALDADGIPPRKPGTDSAAIATAEAICRGLNGGDTPAHLESVLAARWLTPAQAHSYLLDAVDFYCPHAATSNY